MTGWRILAVLCFAPPLVICARPETRTTGLIRQARDFEAVGPAGNLSQKSNLSRQTVVNEVNSDNAEAMLQSGEKVEAQEEAAVSDNVSKLGGPRKKKKKKKRKQDDDEEDDDDEEGVEEQEEEEDEDEDEGDDDDVSSSKPSLDPEPEGRLAALQGMMNEGGSIEEALHQVEDTSKDVKKRVKVWVASKEELHEVSQNLHTASLEAGKLLEASAKHLQDDRSTAATELEKDAEKELKDVEAATPASGAPAPTPAK